MFGNVLFNACRFLVLVLLARFGTVDLVGAFSAAMAWSAPIINFSMLQLRAAYVADSRNQFTFGSYVVLRWLGMGGALIGFAALILWRGSRDPQASVFLPLLAAVCFSKIAWSIGEIYWGVYQRTERLDLMAAANGARGVLMLLPFAIILPLLSFSQPTEIGLYFWTTTACIAYGLSWLVYALLIDRRWAHGLATLDHSWTWDSTAKLSLHAAPLGIVILIVTICDSVPQMVLDDLGEGAKKALGYFSAMAYFILPLNLLILSMGQAAANRIAENFGQPKSQYWRLVGGLVMATATIGGGIFLSTWLIGEEILVLIYGNEYRTFAHVFPVIGFGGALLLLASIFGLILTATRAFMSQVPAQLIVLAVTIYTAWIWIPADPVNGAAWTFVARSGTHAALYGILLFWVSLRQEKQNR